MASNVSTLIITVLSALTFVHCEPWRRIRRQYAATFSEEPASYYRGLDSVYVGSYTPTAYYDSYYGGEPSSGSTGRTFGGKKIIVKKKVGTGGGGYIVGEGKLRMTEPQQRWRLTPSFSFGALLFLLTVS